MANSKMIVVWGNEDILSSSIEHILAVKEGWTVVSTSSKANLEALIQAAENTQSDVVIIQQGCTHEPTPFMLQSIPDHPAIKVITISLENNLMNICGRQKILVKEASDLISAIEV